MNNTEYSLIQLAIRNPRITVDLKRKGLLARHFKDSKLGKVYNLIFNTFTALGSVPTIEELAVFEVQIEKYDIPYTVEHLVKNITQEYNKKLMGEVIITATDQLVSEDGGAEASKDFLLKGIGKLISLNEEKKYSEAVDVADDIWEQYIQRAEWVASGKQGIPLGLDILDHHLKGLGKGWLVTIGARNGVGKSWFLANAVLHAWKAKRNIAVFSCEMTSNEFLQRVLCMNASVNPTRFRDGCCTLEELDRYKSFTNKAEEHYGNQYICNNPLNFENIEQTIQEINEKNPNQLVEAVYIDAVYRLKIDGEKEDVRQKRIAISAKTLAQKLDVPVIITNQMNREFAKMNSGKRKIQGGNYSLSGSDAYNTESDLILLLDKDEETYSSFHYISMVLEKFRHGQDGLHYMLEMNLNIPLLKQVDLAFARSRINFDNEEPKSAQKGNILLQESKNVFQKTYNAEN